MRTGRQPATDCVLADIGTFFGRNVCKLQSHSGKLNHVNAAAVVVLVVVVVVVVLLVMNVNSNLNQCAFQCKTNKQTNTEERFIQPNPLYQVQSRVCLMQVRRIVVVVVVVVTSDAAATNAFANIMI